MKAMIARVYGPVDVLRLEDVETPQAAPGEVLIKVRAVTVNRARDLNVIAGQPGGPQFLPLVPGQDPAGEIVAAGDGIDSRRVGERVIVSSRLTCGVCEECRGGHGSECAQSRHIGIHRWGGYAEFIAAPAAQAIPIDAGLTFGEAAVAMRHFPMAMQQLDAKAKLKPGEWVLVMGASGGLGSACIQVAKLRGAKVIAGAGEAARVAAAVALGADHGIDYRRDNLIARVKDITGGAGVDVICENISDPSTFPAAFACLGVRGRLVTSGAHGGGTVPVDMRQLYIKRQRILGAAGHDGADITNAMVAAGAGLLKAKVERVMPLDQLHQAFELIGTRKVAGKIVIDPGM